MMFKLACGDVMPGCSSRFGSENVDDLLGQVTIHAARDHDITVITPEVLAMIESKVTAA